MPWWITSMAHLTFLFREGWQNHSQCCHFHLPALQHTLTHTEVWPGHIHTVAAIYRSLEPLATLRHSTHFGLANSISMHVWLHVGICVYVSRQSHLCMFILTKHICRTTAGPLDFKLVYIHTVHTNCLHMVFKGGAEHLNKVSPLPSSRLSTLPLPLAGPQGH